MDMTLPMNTDVNQGRNDAQLGSLRAISMNKDKKMSERQMKEVANQFESMVVRQLIKEMRKTIPEGGAIPQSNASQMYTDMIDDHWAQQISEADSFGLKDQIMEELKAKQERIEDPTGEDRFMKLKTAGDEGPEFMALENKQAFMDLPSSDPEFLDLPKHDPFMNLGGFQHISTANISNWEEARR